MSKLPVRWVPDELMTRAFALATKWHGSQVRKGNDDPYISHLMAVSALVIEYGGTQEQATAALLHDILEDTECTKDVLVTAVGQEVADIVEACTHATIEKTGNAETDFVQRKQLYIDHLLDPRLRESAAVLVALADKTHNAESTARNWETSTKDPETFFNDYNGNFESQKWWYESLVNVFTQSEMPEQLLDRFRIAVTTVFGS